MTTAKTPQFSLQKGVEVIETFVKTLPKTPGVYRMLNDVGEALYVGKAKNLFNRVTSYTLPARLSVRIQRMIAQTTRMEFTITKTEAEALLLEANQIKKLKPRYNILLRDDKSFPYIMITAHDFPQVKKHRGARDDSAEYFGPFASGTAVHHTIAVLQRAFMLRTCSDNVFATRTRPCLQYQIRRCTAPCVGKASLIDYQEQVKMARDFLTGKSQKIQEQFATLMQEASHNQHYEEAASYRDRIKALTTVQSRQTININDVTDADVIGLYQDAGQTALQVFFIRNGQNFGNRAYFPRHEKDAETGDILSAFIAQFYTNHPAPRDIYIPQDFDDRAMIEEALTSKSQHKIHLSVPQRGPKAELIELAHKNAKEALLHRLTTEAEQLRLLDELAASLDIDQQIERIEVYDNSHISGTNALGAMIVATPEGFAKNAYRKFNIKSNLTPGDDYAMMREVLGRRFTALLKDDPNRDKNLWPDLVIIDGGQGQLSAVVKVFEDLGIDDVALLAIAKGPDRNAGRERFFMQGRDEFSFEPGNPVLYFLQRLRDEAHRFAIGSHRAKRSGDITKSLLDDIEGIGPTRKKALLLHFGSAKAVSDAVLADLEKVQGISKSTALKVFRHFHESD